MSAYHDKSLNYRESEKFLLSLDVESLLEKCGDKIYFLVCEDDDFWRKRVYRDFNDYPDVIYEPKNGKTWRNLWREIVFGLVFKFPIAVQIQTAKFGPFEEPEPETEDEIIESPTETRRNLYRSAVPEIVEKYLRKYGEEYDLYEDYKVFVYDNIVEITVFSGVFSDESHIPQILKYEQYDDLTEDLQEFIYMEVLDEHYAKSKNYDEFYALDMWHITETGKEKELTDDEAHNLKVFGNIEGYDDKDYVRDFTAYWQLKLPVIGDRIASK